MKLQAQLPYEISKLTFRKFLKNAYKLAAKYPQSQYPAIITLNESILELRQLCYVLTSLNFESFALFQPSQQLESPPHNCHKAAKELPFFTFIVSVVNLPLLKRILDLFQTLDFNSTIYLHQLLPYHHLGSIQICERKKKS